MAGVIILSGTVCIISWPHTCERHIITTMLQDREMVQMGSSGNKIRGQTLTMDYYNTRGEDWRKSYTEIVM